MADSAVKAVSIVWEETWEASTLEGEHPGVSFGDVEGADGFWIEGYADEDRMRARIAACAPETIRLLIELRKPLEVVELMGKKEDRGRLTGEIDALLRKVGARRMRRTICGSSCWRPR